MSTGGYVILAGAGSHANMKAQVQLINLILEQCGSSEKISVGSRHGLEGWSGDLYMMTWHGYVTEIR